MTGTKQHTITALVQNETGTINRLTSMFRRRGISLASFNAGDCEERGFSRLTIVVNGDEAALAQTIKQLDKSIDVVECADLSPETSVYRELALVRIEPTPEGRASSVGIASEFMARTPKSTERAIVFELTAEPAEIERFIEALRPHNVTEVVRTGLVAIKVVA